MYLRTYGSIAIALLFMACSGAEDIPLADCTSGGVGPCHPGSVIASVETEGKTPDLDGYSLTINGAQGVEVGVADTIEWDELPVGTYRVTISGVSDHCTVLGDQERIVNVASGGIGRLDFKVRCATNLRGWIVYTHNVTGRYEIWAARPNGEGAFRVLEAKSWYQLAWPSVSPDGSEIVYAQYEDDNNHTVLWRSDVDGEHPAALTTTTPASGHSVALPKWSPDGTQIVYVRTRAGGALGGELVLIDRQGGNLLVLAPVDPTIRSVRLYPAWSPDGQYIAFASDTSINRIRANGTDEQVIHPGYVYSLDWSAKHRLVFAAIENASLQLFSITDTGVDRTPLTSEGGTVAAWDPTGDKILYAVGSQLSIMNSDGTGKHPVITSGSSSWPTWR